MNNLRNNFWINNLIAIVSLISVSLLWKNNVLLFFVLFSIAVFMLYSSKSKQEIKTFIFCGLLGAAAESVAIHFGAWNYSNPDSYYIPAWLILLWGIASVFIARTYNNFKK
ncbi:MAG: DUF2878 family protein [Nanoarchaeota archaeon]|nr:DUF2878 family protein [Nanoarchaeota archaeon]